MSSLDTAEFRQLLEDEKARLLRARGYLESDARASMDDASGELGARGVDNHLGDQATDTYDRELDEGLDEGVRDTLRQIDAALQRIEDGTYGVCEIGNEPIGEERLRAIPWTTRCINHPE